ncbi:hypothetical protein Ato02nite_069540 [Paractinoplanes toevensis]|uniref:NACHT domain-containing protein n=2 Tax=Paractinoplanes toevensis TaxID=571911 RepID=A0A919THR2_9ACTN|nr:hypothetical protein Ato02nite_069540 [Actinoplanes toevensis]
MPGWWRWLVRVLFGVLAAGSAVWLVRSGLHGELEPVGLVGLLVAVLALAGDERTRRLDRDRPAPTPAAHAEALAGILTEQWPADVAARHLHDPGLLPLAWIEVEAATPAVPVDSGRPEQRLRRDFDEMARRLAELYLSGPKRLVVLGQPGAGKSVAALMLQVGLLKAWSAGADQPVPVLLPVASWNPVTEKLDDFVVARLARDYYGGREEVPRRLLRAGLLLPILDGLDEIPELARGAAVLGINEAVAEHDRPVVVTCRLVEYEDLIQAGSPVLRRAAVVRVSPVRPRDAIDYLKRAQWADPAAWDGVFAEMEKAGSPVAEAYSTPLMVSVARTVYEKLGGDPGEQLDRERYDSRLAVENGVIDRLVDAAYSAPSSRWSAAQARRYLTVLARLLYRDGERDLVWWELPGRMLSVWTPTFVGLFVGLLALIGTAVWTTATLGSGSTVQGVYIGGLIGFGFLVLVMIAWFASGERPGRLPLDGSSLASVRRLVNFEVWLGMVVWIVLAAIVVVAVTVLSGWTVLNTEQFLKYAGRTLGVSLAGLLALVVNAWSVGAASQAQLTSPVAALRHDRLSSLTGAIGSGLVFAWLLGWFLIGGGAIAGLAAALVTGGAGWSVPGDFRNLVAAGQFDIVTGTFGRPSLAFGALAVLPGLAVALVVLFGRAWFRFQILRLVLAPRGDLPWRVFGFLEDARSRDLLRQSAGAYQFRHVRLQERLADENAPTVSAAEEVARARSRRRRLLVAGSLVVFVVTLAVPLLAVPHDRADAVLHLPYRSSAKRMDVSPDGRTLAVTSDDGVRLWRLPTGRPIIGIPVANDYGVQIDFSATGRLVVVRDGPDFAQVWRTDGGSPEPVGVAPPGGGVVLLAGGTRFGVLSSRDGGPGTVLTVRSETGAVLAEIRGSLPSAITRQDSSRDDSQRPIDPQGPRHVLVGADDGSLDVWDLQGEPRRVSVLRQAGGGPEDAVIDSRDTRVLVRASGSAQLFDLATGALLRRLAFREARSTLEFSPGGRWIVGASGGRDNSVDDDDTLTVWDAATGAPRSTMRVSDDLDSPVFGRNEKSIVLTVPDRATADATLLVWPIGAAGAASTFTGIETFQIYRRRAGSVLLVVHQDSEWQGRVDIVDVDSGTLTRTVRVPGRVMSPAGGDKGPVEDIETDFVEPILGETADGHTMAWNGLTGEPLGPSAPSWDALVDSPTGGVFVGRDSDRLALYRSDGSLIGPLPGSRYREEPASNWRWIQFSPDGLLLAAADGDTIRVWDTADGHLVDTLRGHSGPVLEYQWGAGQPTGHTVITAGQQDSTVRLWHIPDGR